MSPFTKEMGEISIPVNHEQNLKEEITICIVGAGFSGLLAGIKLKTDLGLTSYTIFDENHDVGGTWLVNKYPGAACDIHSHLYCYSFEMNPRWSKSYASRQEIHEYLRNVAQKYELYEKIQFNTQVKEIVWDANIKKWRVTVFQKKSQKLEERFFTIVLNGPGALRVPNIPAYFKSFDGPMMHTATWDSTINLEDKVVAVVGNGSSAVQLIPELQKTVKELHCFQRTPAWILPRSQFIIPKIVKDTFVKTPFLLLLFRWFLFLIQEIISWTFNKNSLMNDFAKVRALEHLKNQVPNDIELRNRLTPNYPIGCKRLAISNDYFPAMTSPNVKLHTAPIVEVTSNGIITTELHTKIDVLILGTGFCVQEFFSPMIIIGQDSQDVLTNWNKIGPQSYLGISESTLPNFFSLIGAHTGLQHNSVIFMLECQMHYVSQCIQEFIRREAKVIKLKRNAEETFVKSLKKQVKYTIWSTKGCTSWFKNKDGMITALWPWTCIKYWLQTRIPDFSKYEFL